MVISTVYLFSIFLVGILSIAFNSFGVFACGLIGLLLIVISAGSDKREIAKPVLGVLFISIIFLILHYYGLIEAFGKPYYGTDDERFQIAAKQLVDQKIYFFKDIPYIAGMYYAKGYCLIIAYIMRLCSIFGGEYCTMAPRILNICLWIATSVLVFRILNKKLKTRDAKRIFYILTLFPNALYISSFVYRDALVNYLIMIFVFVLLDSVEKKAEENNKKCLIRKFIIIFCVVYLLIYLRIQLLFVLGLIFLFLLFSKILPSVTYKYIGYAILAIASIWVLTVLGGTDWISAFSDQYTEYRASQVSGLSKFIFTMPMLPFGIFLRAIYGLCVPFPAEILVLDLSTPLYSFIRLLICLGTIFQVFFIPYLFKRIMKLENEALIFCAVYITIISTTFTFRHFLMLYPFMALVIGEEYYSVSSFVRRQRFLMMFGLLGLMTVLYMGITLF